MDSAEQYDINSVPLWGCTKSNRSILTSGNRRFNQQVEKVLSSFQLEQGWADYITFLSKLQKVLRLLEGGKLEELPDITHSNLISKRLSQCLSPNLPYGVHQKALKIYDFLFSSLDNNALNRDISIWVPGFLPVLSYCSIQVKSQVILTYRYLITKLWKTTLKNLTRPMLLSLLPGIDDENSEFFGHVFDLLDLLKEKIEDDAYYWQSMNLCVISNPERRLGALSWYNKRLPLLQAIKNNNGELRFSDEASACLAPEPGLLVSAFASALKTLTDSSTSSDIVVIRGFFDLLLTHLPLSSEVLTSKVSIKDKQVLLLSCSRVTLRKDMSLNRRLWNWLLGPEVELPFSEPFFLPQAAYFQEYALEPLVDVLMGKINSENVDHSEKLDAIKICSALVMDKWEISSSVTKRLFLLIVTAPLNITKVNEEKAKEILLASQVFFDNIEEKYIWKELISILMKGSTCELHLFSFILNNFNFSQDEMIVGHVPLALLTLLNNLPVSAEYCDAIASLTNLLPPGMISCSEPTHDFSNYSKDTLNEIIGHYYNNIEENGSTEIPLSSGIMSYLILKGLEKILVANIEDTNFSYKICSIFCEVYQYSQNGNKSQDRFTEELIPKVLTLPHSKEGMNECAKQKNLVIALTVTKLLKHISDILSPLQKSQILKLVLTNLWCSVVSDYPKNFQVESVKCIFDLEITIPKDQIEAGLLHLLLESNLVRRLRAFSNLWFHSSTIENSNKFLVRPFQVLLDELQDDNSTGYVEICNFVRHLFSNGSANRALLVLISPLLDFDFLMSDRRQLSSKDDLVRFSYILSSILQVVSMDNKHIKDSINNEVVPLEKTLNKNIVEVNGWVITNYKSLLLVIIEKFLKLKIDSSFKERVDNLNDYYRCVNLSLQILCIVITEDPSVYIEVVQMLMENCSQILDIDNSSYQFVLVESKYIDSILYLLKHIQGYKSDHILKIVGSNDQEALLMHFLIKGFEKAHTTLAIESWTKLLRSSIYIFNKLIFNVIFSLNDALIKKLERFFEMMKQNEKSEALTDFGMSVDILMSGFEDLLTISHGYLQTSLSSNDDSDGHRSGESGFLGNVIQGVFSIESPAARSTEQYKRYSILLSYQEAVKFCFKLWDWADSNSSPQISYSEVNPGRSLTPLSNKIKFKAKKILESLIDLERQEVIEFIIAESKNSKSGIKLLQVLDGGRPQVSIPFILNSIVFRCYPQLLEDSKKSSLSANIIPKDCTSFLVKYIKAIDDESVFDIWSFLFQFFRDVSSHYTHFKNILPDCILIIEKVSLKSNNTRLADQKKTKKELCDIFVKVITNSLVMYKDVTSTDGTVDSSQDDEKRVERDYCRGSEEIINVLTSVLEKLNTIVDDYDKQTSCVNAIISNVILTQLRHSEKASPLTFDMLSVIAEKAPTKALRSLVFEEFMDKGFFTTNSFRLRLWKPPLRSWVSLESDKVYDLISKVSPLVLSSTPNIFNWNEQSEIESKLFTLKRICFLILSQDKDNFLPFLDDLFARIDKCLTTETPISIQKEILVLLRSCVLRFSDNNLLSYWITINFSLASALHSVTGRTPKELGRLSFENLDHILASCKLLDQILALGYGDFKVNDWVFVTNNPDFINRNQISLLPLVEFITNDAGVINSKEKSIKIIQPTDEVVPLLKGVKRIANLSNLRSFFNSLSFINYERIYNHLPVNYDLFEEDIIDDLLS